MATIMNFKRVEVSGTTKEEALSKAPFGIMGDATSAYRIARKKHTGAWTDNDMKQFMLDYLAKKSKNLPGAGFSLTVESAISDTRERPYTFKDVKNDKGARKWKTTYEIKDRATGAVLASTDETKAKAKELAKALYTEHGFKGNLECTYTKQVVEGEPVAFTMDYTPSVNSRVGTYICFGVENA